MEHPPILQPPLIAPKRKKRGKLLWFFVGLGILLVAALAVALRKKDPVITVQTEKISRHTITETVVANGKIYPVLQVHISPEVSGEIIDLPVKEGQFVHKGDLLMVIDPTNYQIAVNQNLAAVQLAEAGVQNIDAQINVQHAQIKASQAQVDQAQAALVFAQQQAARYQDLAQKGTGTVQNAQQFTSQLHQQEAALQTAQAQVDAAESLELVGLMGIPPLDWEADRAFARLQSEHQRVRRAHPDAAGLSAGMSKDLEAAVKHGSTCVRVGTALLGQRPIPSPSIVTPVTSSSQTPESPEL